MSTSVVKDLPKSTKEIEVTIPWIDIKDTYETIFKDVQKNTELPGFRKGKVPKKLVEEKVDKTKVYEEVVRKIIPEAYAKAVKDNNLTPVSSPKVDIIKAKENEDWQIKATIAVKPLIKLKNYREKIASLKSSKTKIWTPGTSKEKEEDKKLSLDDIIKAILEEVEIELSDLLITEESNRLLSNLIDQTQKLGMTVEQYLMAKGKTSESIRAEYAVQAAKNLTIEFALAEIADKENITVSQKDLDEILAKVEKPEEKEKLAKDSYYLAHLIRQQKTIDFLSSL